jgi:phospholipase/lecithinase/hemolysin
MHASGVVRIVAVLFAGYALSASAAPPPGMGVLGDSYSDEYRFYPPDRTSARNWVEILADLRRADFGPFSPSTRGEPRNQGYAYNWARSDATTVDLIRTGQHTGLAAQVARGEVKYVFICIGGNDFIAAMKAREPLKALEEALPRAIAHYRTAVKTILEAHDEARVVVATLPDIRHLPEFADPIESGAIPARIVDAFTAAMDEFNNEIRRQTNGCRRLALLDFDRTARVVNMLGCDTISIGGLKLDRRHPSNDPGHFFLADGRHPGTFGQGFMAQMIVDVLNTQFQAGIKPLSHEEVRSYAQSIAPGSPPRWQLTETTADSSEPRPEGLISEESSRGR